MLQIPAFPGETSHFYEVTVNGIPCPVRPVRVSAMPFNRGWPGFQRPIKQTEIAYYVDFYSDGPVKLQVSSRKNYSKALVRPLAKNIKLSEKDGKIDFSLAENGFYVLELDDEHCCLHIFNKRLTAEKVTEKECTKYYGPGIHQVGIVNVESNDVIYIDKEAVLYGGFFGENVSNVRIFGGGVIDNEKEERYVPENDPGNLDTVGCIRFKYSKDIRIEDVICKDSALWTVSLYGCDRVNIHQIAMIGNWRYNSDGLDVVNSSDITLTDSFIRVFDDIVTIKGFDLYHTEKHPVENIQVENCVFWCDWGRTCEVGIETLAPYYRNIDFNQCHCIHNSTAVLDIRNGYLTDISIVSFRNLTIEYSDQWKPDVFELGPGEEPLDNPDYIFSTEFNPGDRIGVADLFFADNLKFWFGNKTKEFGTTHDVLVDNIRIYSDPACPKPRIHIASAEKDGKLHDFTFKNIFINGKKVENYEEEFRIDIEDDVKNVRFE